MPKRSRTDRPDGLGVARRFGMGKERRCDSPVYRSYGDVSSSGRLPLPLIYRVSSRSERTNRRVGAVFSAAAANVCHYDVIYVATFVC